jgi:hypothetical protein
MARNYARHDMHFLRPEIDTEGLPQRAGTEFPVYSYLLAVLFKFFGVHDILGRILSSIFAAWGAVFLYEFVRRRLDDVTALVSALVLCMIPVHIYFTRTVQPEPMALWGLLGFVLYLDRWMCSYAPADAVRAFVFGALAPLLKLNYLYLVLPLWLLIGWQHLHWRALRNITFLEIMTGIMVAVACWYQYARSAAVVLLPLSGKEHLENLRPILTPGLWQAHFVSRLPELCLTYPGTVFAVTGAFALWKNGKAWMWGLWFLCTAVYILLLGNYGLIHRYTELPFAPVNAVFIASGIVYLVGKAKKHKKWLMLLAALVLRQISFSGSYPKLFRAFDLLNLH